MDATNNIHQTARDWFLVRIINGAIPTVWEGGLLDGLEYFPLTLDGVDYLLTFDGLLTPPNDEQSI